MKTNGIEQSQADVGNAPQSHSQVAGGLECARKIERSIAYMRRHLDEPLQVATLAATVNVSPSHFFVLFKRCAGYPPIDYFIRLRMQRACELLRAGSLRVKEVAAALGYDDPFYFSRVFKSVNRIAPSAYRATHKRSNGDSGDGVVVGNFSGAAAIKVLPREEYAVAARAETPVFRTFGKYQFA
ncbi:MAG: helix-turn-helix domain-containing protein [Limisphaerales bacterium]